MRRVARMMFVGLALALARPAPASACLRPGPSAWVSPVPANGVAVLQVHCPARTADCDATVPESIGVIDTKAGTPVPGEVVRMRSVSVAPQTAIVAWRPDEPFVVGRRYEFDWRPVTGGDALPGTYGFEAQPPASWSASDVELGVELRLDVHGSAFVECEIETANSCGEKTFMLETERRSDAAIEIAVPPAIEGRNLQSQLEVRTAYWAEGDEPPELGEAMWPPNSQRIMGAFEQPARRYCYRVELHSLIDDSRALREDCIEHGDLGELGADPLPLAEQADLLRNCIEPPRGFEDAWCEGQAMLCADQPRRGGCERYEACSGQRAPRASADGGADEGADGGAHDGGGCSVHGHRAALASYAWLALVWVALARTRRAQRSVEERRVVTGKRQTG